MLVFFCFGFGNEQYGGNPVSVAVADAVLDVIESENLQQHAKEVGDFLLQALRHLQKQFDCVGDVRGHGLFIGIEIVKSKACKRPSAKLAEQIVANFKLNHVLMSTEGFDGNVLKFKPPMCFSIDDGKRWLHVLRQSLEQATANDDGGRACNSPISSSPIDSGRSSCSGSAINGSISSTSGLSDDSLVSISSSSDDSL
jgi:4-aminobutyrate aminotransferase-like enzyme